MKNYDNIINSNNGIIYANQLNNYNINRYQLKELVDKGILKRILHGVYSKTDKEINEFWLMGQKYKNGIYSHNTALYFYNLTDRTPMKFDMTFPSNNRVDNDFLNVHYIKKSIHKLGAKKMLLDDNTEIQIYDMERTICDIVRDRNKLDQQIFNIALKEYSKRKDKKLNLLYEYAKEFKIEKILYQYMEVLE